MERYVHTEAMEVSEADPVAEWSSPGGETGLEEPMWQLGLGSGSEPYPERPDESDCMYYLRTGFCGYGSRCRFNHPPDRTLIVGAMRASGGDYPERPGQPVCQYYMRTGMCKFGASCKYHHPRQGGEGGSTSTMPLNYSGYPLRPGEKECSYYMRTGQCKFGITCKFHHPQPALIQTPPLPSGPTPVIYSSIQSPAVTSSQQIGVVAGNYPLARPTMFPSSSFPGTFGPVVLPPAMVPFPGLNPYQGPANPVASPNTQPHFGAGPYYGMTQLSLPAPAYPGSYISIPSSPVGPVNEPSSLLPERLGQPDCPHFIKTGECKFGSSCRYHHPATFSVPISNFSLSPMGLPIRAGAQLCLNYAQTGTCRFGQACRFNHPMGTMSYSTSASSLAEMPVVPYSSSEFISGSQKMPTSGSVGSIFSSSGPVSSAPLPPGHSPSGVTED